MKVNVTRACGHEEEIVVYGSSGERERKIKYYESTKCKDCYAADIKEEDKAKGLPELEGSEKQVAWTYSIRRQMLEHTNPRIREVVEQGGEVDLGIERLKKIREQDPIRIGSLIEELEEYKKITTETQAKWFIDHR